MTWLLLCLLSWLTAANSAPTGDTKHTLEFGGLTRSYLLHVPPSYDASRPMPVVLALHGGASNGEQMVHFCGLSEKADEAGFIAVYPNGTGRLERILTWNAGNCCGYASREGIDDVGFIQALLDDLGRRIRIDPKRIYASGISNGGMMAHRLGAELSDRIAAIAPISGALAIGALKPREPVSVMHFHGTADQFAPFDGGHGERSLQAIVFDSAEHTIKAWAKADGCPDEPVVVKEAAKVDDGTSVTRTTYGPGKGGAEVVLVLIDGGGHTWPGRESRARFLGKATQNISANDLMWEFFKKHPKE